jgi:hypothetical protein
MPQGLDSDMIANKILYAGEAVYQEMEVETIANLAPGRLLITDTAEYQVQVAGAAALDVVGVADVMGDKKLTLMQTETAGGAPLTTYAAGDQIRVIRGPVVVKLLLLSGETITVGERLEAAANGMCRAYTTALADIGYALEARSAPATCKWILVKLTI